MSDDDQFNPRNDCAFQKDCNSFEMYGWWWLLTILVLTLLCFILFTYGMIKLFNLYCPYKFLRSYKHQDRRKVSKIVIQKQVDKLSQREMRPGDLPIGSGIGHARLRPLPNLTDMITQDAESDISRHGSENYPNSNLAGARPKISKVARYTRKNSYVNRAFNEREIQ